MATVTGGPAVDQAVPGCVGDLTDEHKHWTVEVPCSDGGFLTSRSFELGKVRRWTVPDTEAMRSRYPDDAGRDQVGLLDLDANGDGLYVGTERQYSPDTPVLSMAPPIRRRRRARRA